MSLYNFSGTDLLDEVDVADIADLVSRLRDCRTNIVSFEGIIKDKKVAIKYNKKEIKQFKKLLLMKYNIQWKELPALVIKR